MPGLFHKSRSILFSLSALILLSIIGSSSVFAADVTLSWDPKTDAGLSGYKLYYGTATHTYGAPINVGNTTTYTVTGLSTGTYYFAVTAPLPAPTNLTVK